ncbi:hypothetical protein [Acinetobacter tandoii]|uniref:Uncharacterized protein n=1 Tax=Acinetobacter tandoii DSM 14970 = CIP 107469 TaxID=1120927 RepID=R9AXB9_9GAMM|nr:hypothetical protein [Acinetobacter tandoii]EOR06837.1 hypothetical protein I593_01704 [Acinetobacter tandoii DSM 14970 = CIP 107469]
MRSKLLFTLVTLIVFTGCSKQESAPPATNSNTSAQFEKLDAAIDGYLDKLDNSKTPMAERKQILCVDYPNVYNKEYAPLLLKNFPQDYTQSKLDQDLKLALDYYKGKDNIQC